MSKTIKKPSLLNWMGTLFLMTIPGVNLLAMILFIIFAKTQAKRSFAIAGLLLTLLYAVLVVSGVRLASRARSAYASCVATGLVACLGFQTLLNLAGVTKALPLTGIPLPLVSHGGSSLVATLLSIGLLMAISDEAPAIRAPR